MAENIFDKTAATLTGKEAKDFQAFRDYRREVYSKNAEYNRAMDKYKAELNQYNRLSEEEKAKVSKPTYPDIKRPRTLFVEKISPEEQIALWFKAQRMHINIDGENCWFDYSNGIMFNYIAMRNAVLSIYPRGRFDQGIVLQGDEFTCGKDQNGITYDLKKSNPFARLNFSIDEHTHQISSESNILGCYAAFWANDDTGTEVLEVMNLEDINSCIQSSKNLKSWSTYPTEFLIKTVIKRVCKRVRTDDRGIQELLDFDNIVNGNDFENPDNPQQLDQDKIIEIVKETAIQELHRQEEQTKEVEDDEEPA